MDGRIADHESSPHEREEFFLQPKSIGRRLNLARIKCWLFLRDGDFFLSFFLSFGILILFHS
ncbi:hypothetical protein NC653_032024 [Populus alba x Populus x berolinensis]|uniref:Uncharacterized protein n=1 Tax=Populus alba x Populus x berolinensis TaxID=444605 RepID=A0AAD6LRK9_9ROSI|nr:hypothetical protein NC653_032024 [Populus alba x Populus x berolinensis]